jgi:hypothetical protein
MSIESNTAIHVQPSVGERDSVVRNVTLPRALVVAGAAFVLAVGAIHAYLAPTDFSEAAYLGTLFFLNAAGAAVAMIGILRGKVWGWGLGLFITAGAFTMYSISRTIGLPMPEEDGPGWALKVEEWGETIGLVAITLEAGYVLLVAYLTRRYRTASARQPVLATS